MEDVPTSESVTPVKLIGSATLPVIVAPSPKLDPAGTTKVIDPRLAAQLTSPPVLRVISPPVVVIETD